MNFKKNPLLFVIAVTGLIIFCCFAAYMIFGVGALFFSASNQGNKTLVCERQLSADLGMRIYKVSGFTSATHDVEFINANQTSQYFERAYSLSSDYEITYGSPSPGLGNRPCSAFSANQSGDLMVFGNKFVSFDKGETIYDWQKLIQGTFGKDIYEEVVKKYTRFTPDRYSVFYKDAKIYNDGFVGTIYAADSVQEQYIDIYFYEPSPGRIAWEF